VGDTEAEFLRGSLLYMAPEIIISRQYNEKADLWSVGVILYGKLLMKTYCYFSMAHNYITDSHTNSYITVISITVRGAGYTVILLIVTKVAEMLQLLKCSRVLLILLLSVWIIANAVYLVYTSR